MNGVSETINDIRRALLHDFGYVLGLDAPDRNGQTVTAIMNSPRSDLDRLQPDDIAGIRSLYSPCIGDCGGDGHVTVDEILTLVNLALGNPGMCPHGSPGCVVPDVALILQAVNNAINGCSV